MNVDLGIWGRLTRVVGFLIAAAMLLGILVCYWPLLQQNERMRKVVLQLESQIQQEEAAERQLQGSIASMSNDPRAVERLAREKLGFAKPGETVIRFDDANSLHTNR